MDNLGSRSRDCACVRPGRTSERAASGCACDLADKLSCLTRDWVPGWRGAIADGRRVPKQRWLAAVRFDYGEVALVSVDRTVNIELGLEDQAGIGVRGERVETLPFLFHSLGELSSSVSSSTWSYIWCTVPGTGLCW